VTSIMIDVVERKTRCRTLDELASAFKCHRCGNRPDDLFFTNFGWRMHYFNYVVVVWDEHRTEIDHVEAAAMSLTEATPAFRSISKRFPKRWVTLQSRDALIGDSDRFEALDEVDL